MAGLGHGQPDAGIHFGRLGSELFPRINKRAMYKNFFKLRRNPFEITPDPSFLFPTRRHNEALAALYYGVRRHKGFVVMTGEVGTGKTLLVRCLLQLLQGSNVAYAYLFNSRLSPVEFLQYVAGDLLPLYPGKNKSELLLDRRRLFS